MRYQITLFLFILNVGKLNACFLNCVSLIESSLEAKVESSLEAKVESSLEAKVESSLEAKVESSLEAFHLIFTFYLNVGKYCLDYIP